MKTQELIAYVADPNGHVESVLSSDAEGWDDMTPEERDRERTDLHAYYRVHTEVRHTARFLRSGDLITSVDPGFMGPLGYPVEHHVSAVQWVQGSTRVTLTTGKIMTFGLDQWMTVQRVKVSSARKIKRSRASRVRVGDLLVTVWSVPSDVINPFNGSSVVTSVTVAGDTVTLVTDGGTYTVPVTDMCDINR